MLLKYKSVLYECAENKIHKKVQLDHEAFQVHLHLTVRATRL